jgi:hypothetical protein
MSSSTREPALDRLHDDLRTEYAQLVDIVSGFDQRLLTIKGWGVTLSLASLGLGFQQNHYGLFLVAALSGLAFWMLEATTKMHQMRYYPRMGDIEFIAYGLFRVPASRGFASSPLIDWSWHMAKYRVDIWRFPFARKRTLTQIGSWPPTPEPWRWKAPKALIEQESSGMPEKPGEPPTPGPESGKPEKDAAESCKSDADSTKPRPDSRIYPHWLFPHVMLPHVVAVVTGTILFVLGLLGVFGPI